jgi:DNA-binding CsgD family transcriptional regulator
VPSRSAPGRPRPRRQPAPGRSRSSRQAAREHLRAAHESFEDVGAAPWAELARSELAATGETARRRDPSTLDDLTPQELKVSLLLAGGRTTREAAAALFLSPKTVEYHLRNAYRKLGIRSREELAGRVRGVTLRGAPTLGVAVGADHGGPSHEA